MKKKAILLGLSVLPLVACSTINSASFKPLKLAAQEISSMRTSLLKQRQPEFIAKLNDFSGRFLESALQEFDEGKENLCFSPTSLYNVLAMLVTSTSGESKEEILSALGMTEHEVKNYTKEWLNDANYKYLYGTQAVARQTADNYVFFAKDGDFVDAGLEALRAQERASSYEVDFANASKEVSKKIASIIKEKTNGLIHPDLNFDRNTLMVLMNILYFKSRYFLEGKLSHENEPREFTLRDGTKKWERLLAHRHIEGKQNDHGSFASFSESMLGGFRLRFLLPKEGYDVSDIQAEDWSKVASETYDQYDKETYEYQTSLFFPEFEAEASKTVFNGILQGFGIRSIFSPNTADFSPVLSKNNPSPYLNTIFQYTKLEVDDEGAEGAAVTIGEVVGSAAPLERIKVFEDFVVAKSFGYMLTDINNTVLFAGYVNEP